MRSDYREVTNRTISDADNIHHRLIEKALQMRCISYLAQIKSGLLTDTIFEIDQSKKTITSVNTQLEREILERKRTESKLIKAKNEAEEATRLKDKFVALVTHDLNSPLNIVYGNLQLLQLSGMLPEKAETYVKQALSACHQMSALITDILSMSRIKDGNIKPINSLVDLSKMIDGVINNIELIAQKKQVHLNNLIPENTSIYVDERMIAEVIVNLVSNAIKFCRKQDTVTIYMEENESFTIVVEDTGVGIDPKLIDDLFRFDKQTTTTGTAGEPGSGIGLPLSHDIVAAHGGTLSVESEVGKGTQFRIELPRLNRQVNAIVGRKKHSSGTSD